MGAKKALKKSMKKISASSSSSAQQTVIPQNPKSSADFMVLSDPQRRAVYDQYGEEGLKGNVPPPNAGISQMYGDDTTTSLAKIWEKVLGVGILEVANRELYKP